ncbi:hypothetical protein WDU94_009074 [Cyamophila willieti]
MPQFAPIKEDRLNLCNRTESDPIPVSNLAIFLAIRFAQCPIPRKYTILLLNLYRDLIGYDSKFCNFIGYGTCKILFCTFLGWDPDRSFSDKANFYLYLNMYKLA